MKMGLFFGNLFWGILLVLWGISLVLRSFGVSLPLARIFFAAIIILFGVRLLMGGSWKARSGGINTRSVKGDKIEYTTLFASQNIDLKQIRPGHKPIEVTVVFGSAYVELPADVAFEVEPTTVFGSLITPRQSHFGFSDDREIFNAASGGEKVFIEANAIFGRLEFVVKPVDRPQPAAQPDSTGSGIGI